MAVADSELNDDNEDIMMMMMMMIGTTIRLSVVSER